MPLTCIPEIRSSHHSNEGLTRAESDNSYQPSTTISVYQLDQWHARCHGLNVPDLGPFMILPVTTSTETEAIAFFEYVSIKHMNVYYRCESWRKTLMFFCQTVPSVRYAAIALALIYRNHLDRNSSDLVHQQQSSKGRIPDKAALLHYNRAIQLLLDQGIGDSTEITAITLLVCYLFTCLDHLAGNYVQAMKHLRGGVELARNIDKAIPSNNNTYDDSKPSGVRTLVGHVTRQIHRLDMQAVAFLVDWTPANAQGVHISQLPPSDGAFWSFEQAADHLHILVARVMGLRNGAQQNSPTDNMPPLPWSLRDTVLGQLGTWSSLFENMLQQARFYEKNPESDRCTLLLRLHHLIVWTLLSSYGPDGEMEYDTFLPQFQQCVALAGDVAAAHERYSGSFLMPIFTPEIGIVPVLYMIGVKCRHPVVRREVLTTLRRQPIRGAVWDSTLAARVVERVIEIEEGGSEEGKMIQSMEQIAAWQRIEDMSWVHVVSGQSAPRLDIKYTFCTREGTHLESLIL
ncbi:putative Transcription factor domain-containing protein [Seiridium unicorne]|uniref:Transcription factor domain-containing protein n=1 Tax=Seiridium unicorne TaxID=138068 RepID=A0ABR2UF69_9PEZI